MMKIWKVVNEKTGQAELFSYSGFTGQKWTERFKSQGKWWTEEKVNCSCYYPEFCHWKQMEGLKVFIKRNGLDH